MMFLLLAACGEAGPVAATTSGFDPFGDAPPCESSSGDGRIDLGTACADGACAGATYAQWAAALGEPAKCTTSYMGSMHCEWGNGVSGYFDDEDDDGAADPESTGNIVFLDPPYDGATTDGLGVGVSMACFGDALGLPDALALDRHEDRYLVTEAHYDEIEVELADLEGPNGENLPDGLVDSFELWGS